MSISFSPASSFLFDRFKYLQLICVWTRLAGDILTSGLIARCYIATLLGLLSSVTHTVTHSCHEHTHRLTGDILIRFGLYGVCVVIELAGRLSDHTQPCQQRSGSSRDWGRKKWHVKRRRGKPVCGGLVCSQMSSWKTGLSPKRVSERPQPLFNYPAG